jgi:rhodanese-related sulfurtransferase
MPYRNVMPADAKTLLESSEWSYLDVRTPEEYEAGHVPGAYNVPVFLRGPRGMSENPDFLRVVRSRFAPGAKLVVGCAMGGRSAQACEILAAQGWQTLANMQCGFAGARDASGGTQPGWQALGYPVETGAHAERSYAVLAKPG